MNKKVSFGKTVLVLSILLSLVMAVSAWSKNDEGEEQSIHLPFASDRILVKFRPLATENVKMALHQMHGANVVDIIPGIDVHVLQIPKNKVKDLLKAYLKGGWVEYAEPDFIAEAVYEPNDPYFRDGKQWGLKKIEAPQAWDISRGYGVKIAICDSGIDQDHEDLAGKIVNNKNFTSSKTVDDRKGHGTHVAGIAAAITNNGKGTAGAGYESSLLNVKVLDDDGFGYYSWIANGIIWAADNGAKVINLSVGGTRPSNTLKDAVSYAWGRGSLLVAAAGNNKTDAPFYPAYYEECIAVAATDQNDDKAKFSNYGDWVDVAAPGVDIFSTLPKYGWFWDPKNYGYISGTSQAAPFVSGVAALVWEMDYNMSHWTVRNKIEDTADGDEANPIPIWKKYGIKRVNAYKAVISKTPPDAD